MQGLVLGRSQLRLGDRDTEMSIEHGLELVANGCSASHFLCGAVMQLIYGCMTIPTLRARWSLPRSTLEPPMTH